MRDVRERSPSSLDDVAPTAPERVSAPTMLQRWSNLSFLHWPFEPAAVQRLLPGRIRVDVLDGSAWVGLVPFRLSVTVPGLPTVPWAGRFAEVNLRTYVVGPDGHRGIWFLSLDAARLGAVVVARHTYRIPYVWSRVRIRDLGSTVRYEATRRWPGPRGTAFVAVVRPEHVAPTGSLTPLERWLTSRWRLYSPARMTLPVSRFGFHATQVDHRPWPLWRARCVTLHESLFEAAGLVRPDVPALAHFSPGVDVRFGRRVGLRSAEGGGVD